MTFKSLLRWSGFIAFTGAVLTGISYLLGSGTNDITMYTNTLYVPVRLTAFIGTLILLLGLPGLYAYQSQQAGKLGLISFVIMFLGVAGLEIGSNPLYSFVPPMLASKPETQFLVAQPSTGYFENQLGMIYLAYFIIAMLMASFGILLFGISTFRAGVYPRAAALLMIFGVISVFFPWPESLTWVIQDRPMALTFMGFAWCGGQVFFRSSESAPVASNLTTQVSEP